jgi:hypothetical protein
MSGDGRFSLESTKVLVIENIKVWIIYGIGFVGLVCFVELVIWRNGLDMVLEALELSIVTMFVGALFSGYLINMLIFDVLLTKPIDWGDMLMIGGLCLPCTGATLWIFSTTVYGLISSDYPESNNTGFLTAVLCTAPIYIRASYAAFKSAKEE